MMPVDEDLEIVSYSRGEDRALLHLTTGALLERTATAFPIASPLHRGISRINWAELSEAADHFPATLWGKIRKCKIREFEIETRGLQAVAGIAMA